MSTAAIRGFVRGLYLDGPATDAALVTRYSRLNDHGAFAELLRRHGPTVLGVCRRTLGHADADDAFQAVFLVLARKAGSVRPPGAVGGWLYGVAVRTARKAKVTAARRRRREMNRLASPVLASPDREVGGSLERAELRAVIDAELGRLPDKLRLPVVLCDLGGKTRAEAARELGLPDGTVAARLHRARKLLADRLTRRGVTLPAAGLVTLAVAEPVSADLARVTLAAAEAFARGVASPALSTTAQTLAEGVVRAMNAGTWKLGLGAVLAAGLVAGGGIMWAGDGPKPARPVDAGKPVTTVAKPEAKVTNDAPGYVTDVSFSTDGKRYAVVAGGKVTVFDAATGKVRWAKSGEALRFVSGPKVEGTGPNGGRVELPPVQQYAAVLGKEEYILRRAAGGEIVFSLGYAPVPYKPWQVARFSPDGERYAGHFGHLIRVYNVHTRTHAVELKNQHEPAAGDNLPAAVRDMFFSADGKKVVGVGVLVAPGNVGLAVWDAATGERVLAMGGEPRPTAAAYSPDGNTLAVGYTGRVDLWPDPPAVSIRCVAAGTATALAFSPDGKTIAAGVRTAKSKPAVEVYLFDAATGKELKRFGGFASALPVTALAFSPDGKTLVAGTGTTPAVAVPDESPKAPEVKVFALTPDPAPPQEPKADPPAIVERNQDTWVWQERPPPKDAGPVTSVAVAPDGKTFATAGDGRFVQWDVATLTPYVAAGNRTGPAPADGVAIAPDGKTLVAVTRDGAQGLAFPARPGVAAGPDGRPVETAAETLWVVGGRPDRVSGPAAAFGPTGDVQGLKQHRLAFTDGATVWARTWIDGGEPGTAAFSPNPVRKVGNRYAGVAYSPDGRRLVFIPNDTIDPAGPGRTTGRFDPKKATHWYAQVWGGGSGEPMAFLPHGTDPVTAVAWASDGRIATADDKGVVVIWDGTTYKERARVKMAGPVTALTFRADGKRFAAGVTAPEQPGVVGAVRIEVVTEQEGSSADNWQRSSTVGLPAAETVRSVAFAPDGLTMIAGTATADGQGGGLRVWDRVKLSK